MDKRLYDLAGGIARRSGIITCAMDGTNKNFEIVAAATGYKLIPMWFCIGLTTASTVVNLVSVKSGTGTTLLGPLSFSNLTWVPHGRLPSYAYKLVPKNQNITLTIYGTNTHNALVQVGYYKVAAR